MLKWETTQAGKFTSFFLPNNQIRVLDTGIIISVSKRPYMNVLIYIFIENAIRYHKK